MSSLTLSPRCPTGLHRDAPKRARAVEPLALDTIHTGDCRVLGRRVADHSVDCIFTDPPYVKDQMHLYGWLAEWAARVLKPNGFLLAYTGQYWKDDTMALIRPHLEYYWDFVAVDSGKSPIHWGRKVIGRAKALLCYRPKGGEGLPRTNVLGLWLGSGKDKRYHTWGQDESTARYYIDCFSKAGDLVVDPFMGGGTTAYVCRQINRRYLGFEIDEAMANAALQRLSTMQPYLMYTELPSA